MKIKLLTSLSIVVCLTACSTGNGILTNTNSGYGSNNIPNTQDKTAFLESESTLAIPYSCENNGTVIVNLANSSVAKINATFPDIQLNNQNIRLYRKPSTSGDRYVDNLNPNLTLEWITLENEAALIAKWADGKTYQATCFMQTSQSPDYKT